MPDDCPVNDESRRALRDLARRAEWRGQAGAAGAALDARTLRELGREIENVLAREPDRSTWGQRASESLAAYCRRAQPDWSADQIGELNRLREDAMIALAPGPGVAAVETEAETEVGATARPAVFRRPAAIALAVVGCIVLIALVLALPHFLSDNSAQSPAMASTTAVPTDGATASATESATAPATTGSATSTSTTLTSASSSTAASATTGASSARVTAIQISPDVLAGDPPEVIVSGTVSTSGTGDVTVDITITGNSGQPQVIEVDESGQNSYNLTRTINLSQWCGQSSVRLTVSSGTVSQSAPIAISGC